MCHRLRNDRMHHIEIQRTEEIDYERGQRCRQITPRDLTMDATDTYALANLIAPKKMLEFVINLKWRHQKAQSECR